jgi:hypothetical protein
MAPVRNVGAHWPTNRPSLRLPAMWWNAEARMDPRPAEKRPQLSVVVVMSRRAVGLPESRERTLRPRSVGAHWPTNRASLRRLARRRVAEVRMLAAQAPAAIQLATAAVVLTGLALVHGVWTAPRFMRAAVMAGTPIQVEGLVREPAGDARGDGDGEGAEDVADLAALIDFLRLDGRDGFLAL